MLSTNFDELLGCVTSNILFDFCGEMDQSTMTTVLVGVNAALADICCLRMLLI